MKGKKERMKQIGFFVKLFLAVMNVLANKLARFATEFAGKLRLYPYGRALLGDKESKVSYGRSLKTCLGRVFNFKFGHVAILHGKYMANIHHIMQLNHRFLWIL